MVTETAFGVRTDPLINRTEWSPETDPHVQMANF